MINRLFTGMIRGFKNGNYAQVTHIPHHNSTLTEIFDKNGNLLKAREKTITKGFAFKSEQLFPSINKQSVYMKLGSDGAYHDTSKVVQKRLYDPKTKECIESKSAMTLYM